MVSTPLKPALSTPKANTTKDTRKTAWKGFASGSWMDTIAVRDFIQQNYRPYEGDRIFLADATPRTQQLWAQIAVLMKQEREQGVLDADTQVPAGITAHDAGYVDAGLEQIVGLQTDKPLKRSIMPLGGIRVAEKSLKAYGYSIDPALHEIFTKYRKTHNDGVFDAYTPEMRRARHAGIITGLPDAYGRGRIIGDYRRVALYGIERLVADKQSQLGKTENGVMSEEVIRDREEINEQIRALKELQAMALTYGLDISQPAVNAKEAIQWTYFGYLGAIKEQNGAAMSLGRDSTYLDINIERD